MIKIRQLPFEKQGKLKILVKKKAETDPTLGCKPEERKTEEMIRYGVVVVDKPKGPTSHQVSEYVKNILEIKKAGHSGTLDPAVTGVLPIALGQATKVNQYMLSAGKEYVGVMHLHKPLEKKKIEKVIKEKFIGEIKQLPPVRSSIKRQWRKRNIYYFDILEMSENKKDVLFRVGCQAGTYIRKLCVDVGRALGVGAHMAELRRTKAGLLNEKDLFTLQDLTDAFWYWKNENNDNFLRMIIQPVERAVEHFKKIWVFDNAVNTLAHGAQLSIPGISKLNQGIEKGERVVVMTLKNELVLVGEVLLSSEEIMTKEKGLAVKSERVFMERGVY